MLGDRIQMTVKTYPTLSRKDGEAVFTAGLRKNGTCVRLHPVSFRRLEEEEPSKKFDRIDGELIWNRKDPRPESFHPAHPHQLVAVDRTDTSPCAREAEN